ncbi:hypothetical protein EJB05_02780, partial [Eragrostis curvula]
MEEQLSAEAQSIFPATPQRQAKHKMFTKKEEYAPRGLHMGLPLRLLQKKKKNPKSMGNSDKASDN